MEQYNFPTTILLGQGSMETLSDRLKEKKHRRLLVISDKTLEDLGIVSKVTAVLSSRDIPFTLFTGIRPNPTDENVETGLKAYRENECDSLLAIGGGSPMDAAKVIKIMASNPPPLKQYDDTLGGDRLITGPMPPLYAVPTTSGTGSEVGRSGVIIMQETGRKTIFFHPDLMPDAAVLEPELTSDMPPEITAATGIDAFVHCMEAYFVPAFHPMADGIAIQGMGLIIKWLPEAYRDGKNLEAREKMQIAAAMGATAFQKGLGMIHSMAHPLSSIYNIHHGLATALLLPDSVHFLERYSTDAEHSRRLDTVNSLFADFDMYRGSLSESCRAFISALGIDLGLAKRDIPSSGLEKLSDEAYSDPCHSGNMFPVSREDLLKIYRSAL